jgi:hypothetical protein
MNTTKSFVLFFIVVMLLLGASSGPAGLVVAIAFSAVFWFLYQQSFEAFEAGIPADARAQFMDSADAVHRARLYPLQYMPG